MTPELSWAPRRDVFMRRSLTTAAVTFAMLVLAGIIGSVVMDLPLLWTLPVAALLTLGFLVDDALRWRAQKYDRWSIVEGHLHHTDQDGTASIPLDQITQVVTRFGNRVVLHLRSGERIVMRYLPFPAETAAQIRALLPARG